MRRDKEAEAKAKTAKRDRTARELRNAKAKLAELRVSNRAAFATWEKVHAEALRERESMREKLYAKSDEVDHARDLVDEERRERARISRELAEAKVERNAAEAKLAKLTSEHLSVLDSLASMRRADRVSAELIERAALLVEGLGDALRSLRKAQTDGPASDEQAYWTKVREKFNALRSLVRGE